MLGPNCSEGGPKPPGATYEGPLYRNVGTMPDGTPVNPLTTSDYTLHANYRYTEDGINGLYFSSNQYLTERELINGNYLNDLSNVYGDNRTVYAYDNVTINNLLDVSNPEIRQQMNITLSSITDDSYTTTHGVGRYAYQEGYSGLIVPSARGNGGVNIIDPSETNFGTYTTSHEPVYGY